MNELKDWISEIANDGWFIYIKRLSANDTGATKSNQVGIYFPKSVLTSIFPSLDSSDEKNPDVFFKAVIDSDNVPEQQLRAIYYNNKTRNEKRITRWNTDVEYTPLQDPDKTGSIALFAFNANSHGDSEYMRSWVCRTIEEEKYVEEKVGEVEPQSTYFEKGNLIFEGALPSKKLKSRAYPDEWNSEFPSGSDIIQYLFNQGFYSNLNADTRILKRRDHEFDLFKLVEHHHSFPLIKNGFSNVEDFIKLANSISNRRKSRSGKSLELHLENIFREEGLNHFETQCVTEGNKKPDFLFPDCATYHNPNYPDNELRMLAVKTTVKDRWRQILNEAHRIDSPFLFTLQQGVSENQFKEMQNENVTLVVPKKIHTSFPEAVRGELLSLSDFISSTKAMYTS